MVHQAATDCECVGWLCLTLDCVHDDSPIAQVAGGLDVQHPEQFGVWVSAGDAVTKVLPNEIDIQGILNADTGFRVEVSHAVRAPIINGQPTLRSCERADCYVRPGKRWVHLITIVDDTAEGLFQQLAALSTEGPVKVRRG